MYYRKEKHRYQEFGVFFQDHLARGSFHPSHNDVAKHTPNCLASALVIISPHRSNGINAGFVLVHSPVPEAVSCRKAFPISEEETDGGISGAITAALPY